MSNIYHAIIWRQYILSVHVLQSLDLLLQKQDVCRYSKILSILADISLIFYKLPAFHLEAFQ